MDNTDVPASREPSASAAKELSLALQVLLRMAQDDSKNSLAEALRKLNEAANGANSAPKQKSPEQARERAEAARQKAGEAATELATAAQKQQELGSEKEASHLMNLAKAVASEKTRTALDSLVKSPQDPAAAKSAAEQLEKLAEMTAPSGSKPSADELEKLIGDLERARTNLENLAANPPASVSTPQQQGQQGQCSAPG